MKISDRGLELIKRHEGLRLEAYPDPGSGGEPWTIGYGHTGTDVAPGLMIDEAEATRLLRSDVGAAEQCIDEAVEVEITQHQFDALVSFVFNLGCRAFMGSTLLKLLNQGNHAAAMGQFSRWDRAGGRVMAGLTKRRHDEAALFEDTA